VEFVEHKDGWVCIHFDRIQSAITRLAVENIPGSFDTWINCCVKEQDKWTEYTGRPAVVERVVVLNV